jgi:ubiquitin-conjugating enzyme E2 S
MYMRIEDNFFMNCCAQNVWFHHQLFFFFQTVKCLLIYPNPESALNEEAGRLLLEQYQDYFSRAKMMTEIHAQPSRVSGRTDQSGSTGCSTSSSSSGTSEVASGGMCGKKRLMEKSSAAIDRKKKEKKKALKRL